MTDHFILPDRLDSSAAPGLAKALLSRRGAPLTLDAGGVGIIGALAFEVVIAAGRQWAQDGHALTIAQPSPRYMAACDALGLRADAPWHGAEGAAA